MRASAQAPICSSPLTRPSLVQSSQSSPINLSQRATFNSSFYFFQFIDFDMLHWRRCPVPLFLLLLLIGAALLFFSFSFPHTYPSHSKINDITLVTHLS